MILELLRSDGYITVNKQLIKAIGLIEANLYCELVSRYFYFDERGQLDEGGYFFNTVNDIEELLGLSKYQQSKAVSKLEELGLIETKLKGSPPVRYFRILMNEEVILELLNSGQRSKNLTFKSQKTSPLKVKKLDPNNNRYNNTKNNNKDGATKNNQYEKYKMKVEEGYLDKLNSNELCFYFADKYKEKYGEEYKIVFGKDSKILGDLKKGLDAGLVAMMIDTFIDNYDTHFKRGDYLKPVIGYLKVEFILEKIMELIRKQVERIELDVGDMEIVDEF